MLSVIRGLHGKNDRLGTYDDVEAPLLAHGEERVDVGARIDLPEVELAARDLVSLPRNVDRDRGEVQAVHRVEDLGPPVAVESPSSAPPRRRAP
jgi:hypothetical protein